MDEFEHALRHSVIEPYCQLLGEIHSMLIYNMRTVPFNRHSAILSLMNWKEENGDEELLGVNIEQLTTAMADVGNNWERAPLRHSEGREGWEESLVGCLKDVGTFYAMAGPFLTWPSFLACQRRELPSAPRGPDTSPFCTGLCSRPIKLDSAFASYQSSATPSDHPDSAGTAVSQASRKGPCRDHQLHVHSRRIKQGHTCPHGALRRTVDCVAERED